jgi:hypothetical protein
MGNAQDLSFVACESTRPDTFEHTRKFGALAKKQGRRSNSILTLGGWSKAQVILYSSSTFYRDKYDKRRNQIGHSTSIPDLGT